MIVIIGSKQWCEDWSEFYWKQAIKFSRLKYPLDETQMYYSLLMSEWWNDCKPWA